MTYGSEHCSMAAILQQALDTDYLAVLASVQTRWYCCSYVHAMSSQTRAPTNPEHPDLGSQSTVPSGSESTSFTTDPQGSSAVRLRRRARSADP